MTAPTIVSSSTPQASTGVLNLPSSRVNGNLLVALIASSAAPTPPAGWTLGLAFANNQSMFWRPIDGTESATATWTGPSFYQAQILQIGGVIATGNPIDAANSVPTTGNVLVTTATSVTTTVDDALILLWDLAFASRTTTVDPSGMTAMSAAAGGFHSWSGPQTTAGASGTKQATFTGATVAHYTAIAAIKPAVSTPPVGGSGLQYKTPSGALATVTPRYKTASGTIVTPTTVYKSPSGAIVTL